MSSVAQFQLIEFIILLTLCHVGIKLISPKIDVPFLGASSAACINALLFAFWPPHIAAWLAIIALSSIALFFLVRKFRLQLKDRIRGALSLTAIGWTCAVAVTAFFLLTTLFFSPGRTQPEANRLSSRDKLLVQIFQGEDSLTHINIAQAINKTGHSTYFLSNTEWDNYLVPGMSPYPQLPHSFTSVTKVVFHDLMGITGHNSSDITSIIWSYILSHYFFMGATIGLVTSCIVGLLRRWTNADLTTQIVYAVLSCLFAIKLLSFSIVNYGFFSQSIGIAGLLLALMIEIDQGIIELRKKNPIFTSLIRIVPIIIVGQSWWILSPILGGFLVARISPEFIGQIRKKQYKTTLSSLSVLALGTIFSFIPAYVQIFTFESDPRDIVVLQGGYEKIGIQNIILGSIAICVALLIGIFFKKAQCSITLPLFYFAVSACGLLTSVAIYQKVATQQFSYYGYKLAWSVAWMTFLGIFVAIGIIYSQLCSFLSSCTWVPKKYVLSASCIGFSVICVYLMITITATHANYLDRSANQVLLSDLAIAIDKAEDEDKILIAMSDCLRLQDYTFQKAASTLQAHWTRDTWNYAVDMITSNDRDTKREQLLSKDSSQYHIYDFTPLIDDNAPTDRQKFKGIAVSRTTLQETWTSEYDSSLCTETIITSVP